MTFKTIEMNDLRLKVIEMKDLRLNAIEMKDYKDNINRIEFECHQRCKRRKKTSIEIYLSMNIFFAL